MIKLSRAGWNNIIIFGVMGFILLINATHENVFTANEPDNASQAIFGDNAVMLTLTINQQIKIERIGNTWRAIPNHLSGQALAQMMRSWQQLSAAEIPEQAHIDQQLGLTITIELAGQARPVVISLFVDDQQLLIYHQQKSQWYQLPLPLYQQLIPEQVFS